MNNSTPIKAALFGAAAVLALTSCAANEMGIAPTDSTLYGLLVGAGSSALGTAQATWITAFQTANPDVTVEYDPSGSGAGRENFQEGASQFAGSDRAFKIDEITAGPFASCASNDIVQLPVYISPIAVIFNLDGIESLNMSADTIAQIFSGKITNWNDPAIAADNAGVTLPDLTITAVHRQDKSGTTGNFTEYLAAAAPNVWTAGAVEEWPTGLGGEGAPQTSGVVDAVSNGNGTIGYADASRADGLGTVAVKVGQAFVEYSPEAAAAIVDVSSVEPGRGAGDLTYQLNRSTEQAGVYPVVLVAYLIGCETYNDPAKAELVREYFSYIVSEEGQQDAAETAGSAPISSDLRNTVQSAIDLIR